MKTTLLLFGVIYMGIQSYGQTQFAKDTFETSSGKLVITFIGHGTLMFSYQDKILHVDPWSNLADYSLLPKADLILVTHQHQDHLDAGAIEKIKRQGTRILLTQPAFDQLNEGDVIKNGDKQTILGIQIEATPAYNTTPGRENFHPKGRDNGYILTFGNKRVYIAGDTEDIPDMANMKNIDIAFLPMNQPYTMLPEQVAKAARMIQPKVLYPYHYGETDCQVLTGLLANDKAIEVRLRQLK